MVEILIVVYPYTPDAFFRLFKFSILAKVVILWSTNRIGGNAIVFGNAFLQMKIPNLFTHFCHLEEVICR
jgi:hypothetical protein